MDRASVGAMGLIFFALAGCGANGAACLHHRDDQSGFLRIERIPANGRLELTSQEMETQLGKRDICEVRGNCDGVFWGVLRSASARLIVETKDQAYYNVKVDPDGRTLATAVEIADKLGLEVVREQRRRPAFVLFANHEESTGIEQYRGQPKWPDLRTPQRIGHLLLPCEVHKFPHGGVYVGKVDDDTLYFDGVSFDELAQYFEAQMERPVVNQTGDGSLYCFKLPYNIWRQCFGNETVVLPGLGLSVTREEVEMEMIVVRDKPSGRGTE